jgi:glycosyltransferase 2 family protein
VIKSHVARPEPVASPRFRWQTVVIVLLTAGLVWLFLASIDLAITWAAIKKADWIFVAAAVVVTLQMYALRARRWQVLLEPLGRTSFRSVFRMTVIGFAVTARVGDVLRPYLLARREGLNSAATFATVIVERLLDLTAVMVLFAVAIGFGGVDVGREIQMAGAAAAAIALAGLTLLFVLAGHPERLNRLTTVVVRRLPDRLARVVEHFLRTFAEGLKIMRSPSHLARAALWSVPIWLSIALAIALTVWAFGVTMSFVGSFLVVGYLTVAVAVPTPGGAGSFHILCQLALTQLFNAPENAAGGAAIVLHAVSLVPVTILGLFYLWQEGLSLGRLKHVKDEASVPQVDDATPARD